MISPRSRHGPIVCNAPLWATANVLSLFTPGIFDWVANLDGTSAALVAVHIRTVWPLGRQDRTPSKP